MLVKAEMCRDANGKFGIYVCADRAGKASVDRIVQLAVDDARQLLQSGDVIVAVNGIDTRNMTGVVGVKELIANSGQRCTIEVRREPLPLPSMVGLSIGPVTGSLADEERRRRLEDQSSRDRAYALQLDQQNRAAERTAAPAVTQPPARDLMDLGAPPPPPSLLDSTGHDLMDSLMDLSKPPLLAAAPQIGPPAGPPPANVPFYTPAGAVQQLQQRPPYPQMQMPPMGGGMAPPMGGAPFGGAQPFGLAGGAQMQQMGARPQPQALVAPAPAAPAPKPQQPPPPGAAASVLQNELAPPMRPQNAPLAPDELRRQAVLTAFKQDAQGALPAEQKPKEQDSSFFGGLVKL